MARITTTSALVFSVIMFGSIAVVAADAHVKNAERSHNAALTYWRCFLELARYEKVTGVALPTISQAHKIEAAVIHQALEELESSINAAKLASQSDRCVWGYESPTTHVLDERPSIDYGTKLVALLIARARNSLARQELDSAVSDILAAVAIGDHISSRMGIMGATLQLTIDYVCMVIIRDIEDDRMRFKAWEAYEMRVGSRYSGHAWRSKWWKEEIQNLILSLSDKPAEREFDRIFQLLSGGTPLNLDGQHQKLVRNTLSAPRSRESFIIELKALLREAEAVLLAKPSEFDGVYRAWKEKLAIARNTQPLYSLIPEFRIVLEFERRTSELRNEVRRSLEQ